MLVGTGRGLWGRGCCLFYTKISHTNCKEYVLVPDEIEEFLRSIEDKIGDKRSNEEVIEELGDGQLPLIETIGNGMTCPTTESA